MPALAGLSTDKATEKLKEIFAAIFTAKEPDNRKDKLQGDIVVTDVSPTTVDAGIDATLTITGKLLDTTGIKVTIDGVAVIPVVTMDKLVVKYKSIPEATAARKAVQLVTDKDNKPLLKKDIIIK